MISGGTKEMQNKWEGVTQADMPNPAKGPVHVHVEARSSDCDGRMDRYWIEKGTLAERLKVYAPEGEGIEIQMRDGTAYLYEDTDEGFSAHEFTECDDPDCNLDARSQRDYTAESMGY